MAVEETLTDFLDLNNFSGSVFSFCRVKVKTKTTNYFRLCAGTD